ncbi:unnamed protein product [Ambrosiozyma monospora]|uniref:Unnamed protein product n=1 Tax=Ambrosiozyma monospora TaxID=43982 RepID=A0ACB5SU00_AMBMO|nr:unnamed protein product [Ambrosiozyma monospora]
MQFKQFILFGVLSHLATALPIQRRAYATVYETSLVYQTVTAGDDSTPTSTQAPAAKQAVATTTASSTEEPNYTYFTWTLGDDLTTTLSFDLNTHTGGFAATFESVIVNTPSATAEAAATTSAAPTTSSTQQAVTTIQATSSTPSTTSTPESTTSSTSTQAEKVVSTSSSSTASASTASSSGDFKSIMLDTTNAKRALHGVDALTWDDTLEQYAQDYANKYDCSGTLTHSGGKYGENLAIGYGYEGAINAWYDEGANYDYGSGCSVYDHFTALVWKSTTKVGCATVNCGSYWGDYVICSYDPAGNVVTECADNVLPLTS